MGVDAGGGCRELDTEAGQARTNPAPVSLEVEETEAHRRSSPPRSSRPAAVRLERASRVESLLREAGAVLLRGFPAWTTADFDGAMEALGYEELPYVGGAAPRTDVVGRVFTANESPPDQKIPFHHEMAQVSRNQPPALAHLHINEISN